MSKKPRKISMTNKNGIHYNLHDKQIHIIEELLTYTGKEKLEQKMVIIKKYLQDEWQLDLDVLRKEVRSRYPYVVGKDFEGNTVPRKDFSTLNLN